MANRHHRQGLWVSVASMAWTAAASSAEIALGVMHGVLSLVVFGAAGVLDLIGSTSLVFHFRHGIAHDVLLDHHERRSTLIVSGGLLGLGVVTLAESTRRLIAGTEGSHTGAGVAIAAAAVIVLAALAFLKRRIAQRVDSTGLLADSHLSAVGALLALIAVVGATVGTSDDLWWIDPVAAIVIAVVAVAVGIEFTRRAGRLRSADRAEPT